MDADTLAAVQAALTPSMSEGTQETVEGTIYGGVPHWMYDPVGTVLSRATVKVPMLIPVLCTSPESAQSQAVTATLEVPAASRWRERR